MQANKTLRVFTRHNVIKALFNKSTPVQIKQVSSNQVNMGMGMFIPRMNFGSLPSHMKLEMPNLSPTMEKVSVFYDCLIFRIGKHWSLVQKGR
jgi:hypothetical protein